jgi:hypothetical protein
MPTSPSGASAWVWPCSASSAIGGVDSVAPLAEDAAGVYHREGVKNVRDDRRLALDD